MSMQLDAAIAASGTRFRLFAQPRFLPAFAQPETVTVSVTPDHILPGPEDDRMFVVDAINKKRYGLPGGLSPQSVGQRRPPVQPGPDGHFDQLDTDSREFSCATMYATVRRTLDIWQDYFGHKIQWFFNQSFAKLLLIPMVEWDNAQSGYGFLEFGFGRTGQNVIDHNTPYCQNFDVLSHEIGHNILFTELGLPDPGADTPQYDGHQEAGADLTAIVAVMHFDSVIDHILENSKGNLFSVNELSRLGELSSGGQIREAFNYLKMSDVGEEPHDLSQPMTGAMFDIFVDVFQRELVDSGLITQHLADRSANGKAPASELPAINAEFAAAYAGHEAGFKLALLTARDYLGRLLAQAWSTVGANNFTYAKMFRAVVEADEAVSGGAYQTNIRECFEWREIFYQPNAVELRIRRIDKCGYSGQATSQTYPVGILVGNSKSPAAPPRVYVENGTVVGRAKARKK